MDLAIDIVLSELRITSILSEIENLSFLISEIVYPNSLDK